MIKNISISSDLHLFNITSFADLPNVAQSQIKLLWFDENDSKWQDITNLDEFNLTYIDENGKEKKPVMLHRATFGSYERFLAMIIEHYQGAFPLWLSPVQTVLIPISERHIEYASSIVEKFFVSIRRASAGILSPSSSKIISP